MTVCAFDHDTPATHYCIVRDGERRAPNPVCEEHLVPAGGTLVIPVGEKTYTFMVTEVRTLEEGCC